MKQDADMLIDFHWMFDLLHHIEVGLVVLNRDYEVQLWNSFMENHSGISSSIAKSQSLFSLFPDLDSGWLNQKIDNVFGLNTPFFISWEQRPHVFPFKCYRPLTSMASTMYQNIAIRPISSPDGKIQQVCMVIYDVTDVATYKKSFKALTSKQ
ncbi:hypothetical protein [Marinomonas epiphytica]